MSYKDEYDNMPEELKELPSGMLSSPHIKRYINHGWLIILPEGSESINENEPNEHLLQTATYVMRLGTPAIRYQKKRQLEFNLGKAPNCSTQISKKNTHYKNICTFMKRIHENQTSKTLILPPNSLTFVTTYESFRLPIDVIARFNLKVSLVHEGLLLGTGPLVEPQFTGELCIPIHNFSNQDVAIDYLAPLISVEFTKTLPVRYEEYFVNNKTLYGNIEKYIKPVDKNKVESSVFSAINELKVLHKKIEWRIKAFSLFGIITLFGIIIPIIIMLMDLNTRIDNANSTFNSSYNSYEVNQKNIFNEAKILHEQSLIYKKINKYLKNELKTRKWNIIPNYRKRKD